MWLIKVPISTARSTQGKISFKKEEKDLCWVLINLIFTTSLEKQS